MKWVSALLLIAMQSQAYAELNYDLSDVNPASPEVAKYVAWATPALTGGWPYAFRASHAVDLFRLTGNAAWCTDVAILYVDGQVKEAEAQIAKGLRPFVAYDSYLEVGAYISDLALTYQYCPTVTAEQKTRWGAYAEQTIYNVW